MGRRILNPIKNPIENGRMISIQERKVIQNLQMGLQAQMERTHRADPMAPIAIVDTIQNHHA